MLKGRRAADYADNILNGAKPAVFPVERSMRFERVINPKTAKQVGRNVPRSGLYHADEVIG